MKLFGVSLGNRKGEFEMFAKANFVTKENTYQALANGVVFFQSTNYDEVREAILNAVELHEANKTTSH
jgi:hypothetical protein